MPAKPHDLLQYLESGNRMEKFLGYDNVLREPESGIPTALEASFYQQAQALQEASYFPQVVLGQTFVHSRNFLNKPQ